MAKAKAKKEVEEEVKDKTSEEVEEEEKPKKKKRRHLKQVSQPTQPIVERLTSGQKVLDHEVRHWLSNEEE